MDGRLSPFKYSARLQGGHVIPRGSAKDARMINAYNVLNRVQVDIKSSKALRGM
jgi:hypothetical protein